MRCPKCGSKKAVECTNKLCRYGSFIVSIIIGAIPALVLSFIDKASAAKIAHDLRCNMCNHADYKCNCCKHNWSESLL